MSLKNTHLIVCNYEQYPLIRLLAEEESTGFVFFETRGQRFEVNDICYFMYKNLPDNTNRVILQGVVCKTDYGKSENEEYICDTYPEKFRIRENAPRKKGMLIGGYRLISLNDKEKFNDINLKNVYSFNTFLQQTHLYFKKEHELLYQDLSNNISPKYKDTLKKVQNYFSEYLECAFKQFEFPSDNNEERKKRQHISFTSGHSLIAFSNNHHLIQDSVLQKNGCPKIMRNHPNNLIKLCPVCHAQIHNGTKDIVLEMFDYLYEQKEEWFEKTYKEYAQNLGKEYKSVKEWMHEYYSINKL